MKHTLGIRKHLQENIEDFSIFTDELLLPNNAESKERMKVTGVEKRVVETTQKEGSEEI